MFRNPFSFEGRIRRREYGISLIIFVILFVIIAALDASSGGDSGHSILILFLSPLLWFQFAQGTKRCHDIGSSGLWQLLPFFLLWLIIEDGQYGANQYGENLKGIENPKQQTILDLRISEGDKPHIKTSIETPKEMKKNNWLQSKVYETNIKPSIDMPKEIEKNRWLNPTDGLGKMEAGVEANTRKKI